MYGIDNIRDLFGHKVRADEGKVADIAPVGDGRTRQAAWYSHRIVI